MKRIPMLLVYGFLGSACSRGPDGSVVKQETSADATVKRRITELIQQLNSDYIKASEELRSIGKPAFPQLIENLDETDYSWSKEVGGDINYHYSVGDECYRIVKFQVRVASIFYKSRESRDGTMHMYPDYFRDYAVDRLSSEELGGLQRESNPNTEWMDAFESIYKETEHRTPPLEIAKEGMRMWWADHNASSVFEMKLMLLRWRIAYEENLGFQNDELESKLMDYLHKELDSLLAEQEHAPPR